MFRKIMPEDPKARTPLRTALDVLQKDTLNIPALRAASEPTSKLDPFQLDGPSFFSNRSTVKLPSASSSPCISERQRNIAVEWVRKDWKNLSKSKIKYHDDKEIVLTAIEQNSHAIDYASDRLKSDKEVVSAALWQNSTEKKEGTVENIKQSIWDFVQSVYIDLHADKAIQDEIKEAAQTAFSRLDDARDRKFETALEKAVAAR
jgi:hypothetical protein